MKYKIILMVGILIVIGFIVAATWLICVENRSGSLHPLGPKNTVTVTVSRLHALSTPLLEYALKHDGAYPDSWKDLLFFADEGLSYELKIGDFVAPCVSAVEGSLQDVDQWSRFILRPGARLNDTPAKVLVYCECMGVTVVMFSNTTINRLSQQEWKQIKHRGYRQHM